MGVGGKCEVARRAGREWSRRRVPRRASILENSPSPSPAARRVFTIPGRQVCLGFPGALSFKAYYWW